MSTLATKNSDLYQLSFADVFEVITADDKSNVNDKPHNNNSTSNESIKRIDDKDGKINFTKDTVTIPKELEELIEQFFTGKI